MYNTGNWRDGLSKFNKFDIIHSGLISQVDYFIEKYPSRANITTWFISGDDHEGWWSQREGINIGEYTEMKAVRAGRSDLKYLGYLEADIRLNAAKGYSVIRLIHPGGGSAYALSYSPQNMIESFQGGEKPHILLIGHYHKAEYIYYRNVHCIQTGCTQDQTPFLRKHRIQVSIGGWIIEFTQSADGTIKRFKTEFLPFLNRNSNNKPNYYNHA